MSDIKKFVRGKTQYFRMDDDGQLHRLKRKPRFKRLDSCKVTAVDYEAGVITVNVTAKGEA